ncbi:hypothetical protein COX97_04040 [Candidatus Pacearchaeota archaeon CG_4_10_14_0_2_um_filter_05_32_18]|nr:MAG: hypothetical protein COX97_04040 [Candidatus Pacearchaeota archaeon CG_4_10_14_0_2_um_filter_05_32_18]
MGRLIKENNIKKAVKELDKEKSITSVSADVNKELERVVEEILREGIRRARTNNRRTLLGRDL